MTLYSKECILYQIKDVLPSNILESLSNDDSDPEDNAWQKIKYSILPLNFAVV